MKISTGLTGLALFSYLQVVHNLWTSALTEFSSTNELGVGEWEELKNIPLLFAWVCLFWLLWVDIPIIPAFPSVNEYIFHMTSVNRLIILIRSKRPVYETGCWLCFQWFCSYSPLPTEVTMELNIMEKGQLIWIILKGIMVKWLLTWLPKILPPGIQTLG